MLCLVSNFVLALFFHIWFKVAFKVINLWPHINEPFSSCNINLPSFFCTSACNDATLRLSSAYEEIKRNDESVQSKWFWLIRSEESLKNSNEALNRTREPPALFCESERTDINRKTEGLTTSAGLMDFDGLLADS